MQVELATNHFEYLPSLTQMIETSGCDDFRKGHDLYFQRIFHVRWNKISEPFRETNWRIFGIHWASRQLAKYYVPFRYGFIELCLIRVLMNVVAIAGTWLEIAGMCWKQFLIANHRRAKLVVSEFTIVETCSVISILRRGKARGCPVKYAKRIEESKETS